MKAIKIDALNQTITEIEIDGSLESFYAAADCEIIETAGYFDNGDIIYVDEEGMMNEIDYGFKVTNFSNPQPFFGSGVVTRINDDGEPTDCKSDLDAIKDEITFWN